MAEIKLLPESIINKIAAGEVIDRPASIVKELIENSLDAKATQIIVEVEDFGKQLIRVADNGEGMSEENAKKSILRHATSKIQTAEDLFSIRTLGFRGEALASIAAVSQMSITTKQDGLAGFHLIVEGGEMVSSGIKAAEQGTAIAVRNIFFNTPARKKFLKTDSVELRHIINVVTQYALLHNNINFILRHDGRELLNSPAVDNLINNAASLYGIEIAKELISVNYEDGNVKISGLIVKPYHARNDKNMQTFFVNDRWIKNEDLTAAVYQAYHSILFVNKHPIFILNLELDPQRIDVNVHPTKSEIKIEQKDLICSALTTAIRLALQNNNLLPDADLNLAAEFDFGTSSIPINLPPKYAFDRSEQMVLKSNISESNYLAPARIEQKKYIQEFQQHSTLPPLKLLGQIHKTFFSAETPGGMFFIDQHAAHERVLYELFMEQFMRGNVEIQNLLKPEIIEFQVVDAVIVNDQKDFIISLGFTLEEFGNNSFVVKTIPAVFGRLQPKEMIQELVDKLRIDSIDNAKESIITRMACRSAVMAGEELTILEMDSILKELSSKQLPFTCPHGRPTMIKVSVDELEKKFRRK
ncbi:MAG TPA: DNA mismatch repair endonuclease MutL [Candidatus Nanoarchaeia archaeon]|nr:DNA mismatch repair endonuclease MutL [Candidatus Nanoarchaeia archaeon]